PRAEIRPHYERVREVSVGPAEAPGPPGRRRADREVFLSGIAVQQGLEAREQRHVERGAPRTGEALQPRERVRADLAPAGAYPLQEIRPIRPIRLIRPIRPDPVRG